MLIKSLYFYSTTREKQKMPVTIQCIKIQFSYIFVEYKNRFSNSIKHRTIEIKHNSNHTVYRETEPIPSNISLRMSE